MAYKNYIRLWESEIDKIIPKKDKVQHMKINHLKLEVYDTYKNDLKIITNFKAVKDSDVINKAYQDEKLTKIDGHLPFLEKDYNEFILHYNKQSVEQHLIRRAEKTNIQILYDKCLVDNFPNADKVLKNVL